MPDSHTSPTPEGLLHDEPPLWGRVDWGERFPWLVQGVTLRADARGVSFDLRIGGPAPGEDVLPRWDRLREGMDMGVVVHARQVHGRVVRVARPGDRGLLLAPPGDGHLTRVPGVLLTVSVADCVPVFLVEPSSRSVGLLHAGWRGVAAGILEEGIRAMEDRFGVSPSDLHVHLGPAIGGTRYEVGPEVHAALGLPEPLAPTLLDLRAHLVRLARDAGVGEDRIGVSPVCVLSDSRFFSHRGGDEGRQMAVLGIRRGVLGP